MPTLQQRLTVDLAKKQAARLAREAKRRGLTPRRYMKKLIELGLEQAEIARTRTFAQIIGPIAEEVDEAEIDRLVDLARTDFHNLTKKKK